MKQLIRVMKALADPNRVRIMKMLEQREMCVCEICAALQYCPANRLQPPEDPGRCRTGDQPQGGVVGQLPAG